MVDSATSRFGARKQSLGSNVNTWGDTKLNDVLDLFDRGAKGYQAIAMTGDTTLTWTNYATTNQGQVQTVKLTGSLSSAASLIIPSKEWAFTVINAAGATVTVKTSAGTGVAIPTGYQAALYCDGTDVGSAASILGPTFTPDTNYAFTNKLYVDTAIANSSIPAASGAILNSGSDTTAGYLDTKLVVTNNVGSAVSLQLATVDSAANEKRQLSATVNTLALLDGGTKTTAFTSAVNTKYVVDCTSTTNITTLGPSAPQVGELITWGKMGTGTFTFNLNGLKFKGSTSNPVGAPEGLTTVIYTGASRGWVDQ